MVVAVLDVNMNKKFNLIFGIFLMFSIIASSLVSASYYGGNYGYENYYNSYNYGHNYRNYNYKSNIISTSSSYKKANHFFYKSGTSNYRSYNSYYSGYSNVRYGDRNYVLNLHYPDYSYVTENSYKESNTPYGYSKHEESNQRLLSRPEHHLIYWTYR
jgi:hypothetical protein